MRRSRAFRTQMADGFLPPSTSLNPAAAANPCRWCGAELDIDWCEVNALGRPVRVIPGEIRCPTPGCVPRCPTCHGAVGDIHGPHCGDIMAAKLGDLRPCTITSADCGSRLRNNEGPPSPQP